MDNGSTHPPNAENPRPAGGGHHGHQRPFLRLLTPDIVAQIEDASAVVRDAGRADLSERLDIWLGRVTWVTTTIRDTGECGPELYIG